MAQVKIHHIRCAVGVSDDCVGTAVSSHCTRTELIHKSRELGWTRFRIGVRRIRLAFCCPACTEYCNEQARELRLEREIDKAMRRKKGALVFVGKGVAA
jgi:hypothetical protein